MAYSCIPCDRCFGSQQALQQHLNSSAHEFGCDECERSFGSQQALQQHLKSSAHIFDSNECDSSFGNQQALQPPLNPQTHVPAASVEYNGIPRSTVSPVFATAVRLRFRQPTVDDIVRHTNTNLDKEIVSAIIAAALRLLPVDNTPFGIASRTEKRLVRTAEATNDEDGFCAELSRHGYSFLREDQQQGEALTPDVRFHQPTSVCGHLCLWLEYKSYFGFRANPFLASKNKKRFRKYATEIGPGAVVYKLGFETGHVNIDGVMIFREKEVLQDLVNKT